MIEVATLSSMQLGEIHRAYSPYELAAMAASALRSEVLLTPKPALVDRRGPGAHSDLSLDLMLRSVEVLEPGFRDLAGAASGAYPSFHLREALGEIGRQMERDMLHETDGVNTHRGAIWVLGLLVSGASMRDDKLPENATIRNAAALATLPDRINPSKTNGEIARSRYGLPGARDEAISGFPHVVRFGLPALLESRRRGNGEQTAAIDALLAIMSNLSDTCLLHRGGMEALQFAQTHARDVLHAGGIGTDQGQVCFKVLHEGLMERWASPGGSADLLAATLFLDVLEGPPLANQSLHFEGGGFLGRDAF
jgi:triphosphoribosyl-dephospho-CoA synthase